MMALTSRVIPVTQAPTSNSEDNQDPIGEASLKDIKGQTSCVSVPLYVAMKPFIFSMKLFGLFFQPESSTHECRRRCLNFHCLEKTYHTSVIVILSLNLIRLLTMFNREDEFGPLLFSKISYFAWFMLCYINYCCMHYACSNSSALDSFLQSWHEINSEMTNTAVGVYRKRTIAYTTVAWIVFGCNVAFGAYSTLESFVLDITLAPFTADTDYIIYMRIMCIFMHVYLSASWVFTYFFALHIMEISCGEFKKFHRDFHSRISSKREFSADMECYRLWHQQLCDLVSSGDNAISFHTGAHLALNLVIMIMILYNLIWWPQILQDPSVAFMNCFWFMAAFLKVSLTFVWTGGIDDVVSSFIVLVSLLHEVNNVVISIVVILNSPFVQTKSWGAMQSFLFCHHGWGL